MPILLTLIVTAVLVQITSLCTTVYLHRTLAHRALQLHPAVAFLMRLELWLFTGMDARQWVAVHRKHHRYSDQEGDPHSPLLVGLWNVLFFNALYYRRECKNEETVAQFGKDIPGWWMDRVPFSSALGPIAGGLLLASFLGVAGGLVAILLHGIVYIGLSAAINGAGHAIGYRNFDNTATNLRSLALVTAGEGLHNNHHEFPVSAKFSTRASEFDPAWPVIILLRALRLATVSSRTAAMSHSS